MGAIKKGLLETGTELRETHTSWVFLTDRDADKIKKLPDSEHVVLDTNRPIDENVATPSGRLTSRSSGFTG